MTQLTVVSEKADMVLPLINDAIKREIVVISLGIKRTREVLREFEKRYGMKTKIFYTKISKRQLKENLDFIEWEGEYETLERLQDQLRELKGTKIDY